MTLPCSGEISISQIEGEFGGTAPTSISEYYGAQPGVPVSPNAISWSDFYCLSAISGNGYFVTGNPYRELGVIDYSSEIDGIDFVTDIIINPSASIARPRASAAGLNSTTKGYVCAGTEGFSGTSIGHVEGFIFSTQTVTTQSVSVAPRQAAAGVNSSTRGYLAGGDVDGPPFYSDEIDGLQFSTETYINPAATLILERRGASGFNNASKGYFAGGRDNYLNLTTEIDGILFSSETAFNSPVALISARTSGGSFNSATRGYLCGGFTAASHSGFIDGVQFSSETGINPSASIIPRGGTAGVNSTIKGYIAGGGLYGNPDSLTEIDGLVFSSETYVNYSAALVQKRKGLTGFQSGGTY